MKMFVLTLVLLSINCGGSGNLSIVGVNPSPTPAPVSGNSNLHLVASRNGGIVSNATYTSNGNNRVSVPAPANIAITNNTAQAFTATLIIKTTTCNYTHNAGSSTMNSVDCGVTFVDTNNGDTLLLSINPGPGSLTSIETDVTISF